MLSHGAEYKKDLILESMTRFREHLKNDGIILYPTETLWGLGVRADSSSAIKKLNAFKNRKQNQPMSLLVPNIHRAQDYAIFSEDHLKLVPIFWPGLVTFVLPCKEKTIEEVHARTNFVGLRVSNHPFVKRLFREIDFAITTTSANPSGEPAGESLKDFESLPSEILKPAHCEENIEVLQEGSLVVKLVDKTFEVLRPSSEQAKFEKVARSLGFIKKTI